MQFVYLVRHGAFDASTTIFPGRLPVPLSEEGRKQAQKMAIFFADKNIVTIYSSAVLRCKETVDIIGGGKIPVVYDARLLEVQHANQGYWGTGPEDQYLVYSQRHVLGGEGYADVQSRMLSFFREVILPAKGNVVICSHGDPLHLLYMSLAKIPHPDETKLLGYEFPDEYLPKAGIREVVIADDGSYELLPIVRIGSEI